MRRKSIPPFAALFVLSSAFAASAGKFSATIEIVVDAITAARPDTLAQYPLRHPPFSCNSRSYVAKCSPE
jgi:hypothetical protein